MIVYTSLESCIFSRKLTSRAGFSHYLCPWMNHGGPIRCRRLLFARHDLKTLCLEIAHKIRLQRKKN